jgi:hypothetical protein
LTLLVVLVVHLGVIAALWVTPLTGRSAAPAAKPVELLYLPPANFPKVRSDVARPRRWSAAMAIDIAPPELIGSGISLPAAASSDGSGAGVDWAAEARRALQAFEIRSHQPPSNNSVSRGPAEDNWWPHAQHHAGDRYKTAGGDWIVWISDRCYQVAGIAPGAYAAGGTLPQTICPAPSATPRNGQ